MHKKNIWPLGSEIHPYVLLLHFRLKNIIRSKNGFYLIRNVLDICALWQKDNTFFVSLFCAHCKESVTLSWGYGKWLSYNKYQDYSEGGELCPCWWWIFRLSNFYRNSDREWKRNNSTETREWNIKGEELKSKWHDSERKDRRWRRWGNTCFFY